MVEDENVGFAIRCGSRLAFHSHTRMFGCTLLHPIALPVMVVLATLAWLLDSPASLVWVSFTWVGAWFAANICNITIKKRLAWYS